MISVLGGFAMIKAILLAVAAFGVLAISNAFADSPTTAPTTRATDTFTLVMIDRDTKKPIAGAQIQAFRRSVRATTDAQGTVRISLPPGDYDQFDIYAKADGYVHKRLYWSRTSSYYGGDLPATYTLLMEPGTTMSGTVVDDTGIPIAGAYVYVVFPKRFDDPHELYNSGGIDVSTAIRTDKEGHWHVDLVPNHLEVVQFGIWDYQHITGQRVQMERVAEPAKLYDGTAVATLPLCVAVEGTVTDAAGGPFPGAEVKIEGTTLPPYSVPWIKSDAHGKFSMAFAANTHVTLTVTAKGHPPVSQEVVVGTTKADVVFKIDGK
jgi:hypothetical protein